MRYGSLTLNRKTAKRDVEITRNGRNGFTVSLLSFALFCCIASYSVFGPRFDKVGLGQTTVTVSTAPTATIPTSLPIGWEVRYTTAGVPFYYDAINDVTSWSPPAPVEYPTVLNTPLFSQANPAFIHPTDLITNPPLHKWGQFGIGPAAYAPYGLQVTIVSF
jgi:hypothetical protein